MIAAGIKDNKKDSEKGMQKVTEEDFVNGYTYFGEDETVANTVIEGNIIICMLTLFIYAFFAGLHYLWRD
jgi:hypothetical protein